MLFELHGVTEPLQMKVLMEQKVAVLVLLDCVKRNMDYEHGSTPYITYVLTGKTDLFPRKPTGGLGELPNAVFHPRLQRTLSHRDTSHVPQRVTLGVQRWAHSFRRKCQQEVMLRGVNEPCKLDWAAFNYMLRTLAMDKVYNIAWFLRQHIFIAYLFSVCVYIYI